MKNENPLPFTVVIGILLSLTAGSMFYEAVIAHDPNFSMVLSVAIYQSAALFCAWAAVKVRS